MSLLEAVMPTAPECPEEEEYPIFRSKSHDQSLTKHQLKYTLSVYIVSEAGHLELLPVT